MANILFIKSYVILLETLFINHTQIMKTFKFKNQLQIVILLLITVLLFSFVKYHDSQTIEIDYKNSKVSYYGVKKVTDKDLLREAKLIDIADRRFEAKWLKKDSKGISEEYTSEDAVFMKPNTKPRLGREEIEKEFALSVKGVDRVQFFQDELQFFGELDVAFQRCHMLGYVKANKEPIFEGSYVILWKKEKGEWLIEYDMFNADK